MIADIFLYTIYGLVYTLTYPIRLLADVSLNSGISEAINTATTYLASVSAFLPISTIFVILGIYIGIEIAIFTYKAIMWIIKRFPTQS